MVAGAGESLRFELGPVEIEFAVTVRRDGGGSASVDFMVVTAEAKADLSSEVLHRVALTLYPKDRRTGRAAEISGRMDRIPSR
jgi:hypothetical protein